jgi:predicted XRE-type DNA-binding protein
MIKGRVNVEKGSGNVSTDLGFPNPEEALLKADLVILITRHIREREFTQVQAGEVLGIPQSKVSDLLRGKLRGFSVERLLSFLLSLGNDIEISIRERRRKDHPGHLRLSA